MKKILYQYGSEVNLNSDYIITLCDLCIKINILAFPFGNYILYLLACFLSHLGDDYVHSRAPLDHSKAYILNT